MKNILQLAMIPMIFLACEKGPQTEGIVYATDVMIVYKNDNGEDLLNPDAADYLGGESDIATFVLKNGVKEPVFHENLDHPKNFAIQWSDEGQTYYLRLYFDVNTGHFDGDKVTMFIRYPNGTEDKLVGEFNEDRRINTILQKVWINNSLVLDRTGGSHEGMIEIIK